MKNSCESWNMLFFFIWNLSFILITVNEVCKGISTSDSFEVKNTSVTDPSKHNKPLEEEINVISSLLEPSVDIELNEELVEADSRKKEELPSDDPTQKAVISNEILSSDALIMTISESSTVELQKLPDVSQLVTIGINEKNETKKTIMLDEKVSENITQTKSVENIDNFQNVPTLQKNVSGDKSEDIPSFSEWAQKRLEEVEKYEQVNTSSKGQSVNGSSKGSSAKLRWKNYASLDCGAKVIGANPESVSPGAILSPSSDEYILNTCTSRIWFIVELCEAIQIQKIDLANYELFSSSPQDFVVSISDRYPTREWSVVGKFTAKDERDIQSFDLETQIFGKYIKVDVKSHYGSEHYCPISLFRAYGTSVFEVLQKEDPANVNRVEDDDDEDDDHITVLDKGGEDVQKNLFSSATDAVISIVKRAAEVLGNKVNNQTIQEKTNGTNFIIDTCSTPSYMIYCNNCSDTLYGQIYELISCKTDYIDKLVEIPFLYNTLINSLICRGFGYEFKRIFNIPENAMASAYWIKSFFSLEYIGAMCNRVSILENSGVLNITQQFLNTTETISTEKLVSLKIREPHISKYEPPVTKAENRNTTVATNSPRVDNTEKHISNASDMEELVLQIKPTKALTSDIDLSQTDINVIKTEETILSSDKTSIVEPLDTISLESFNESNTNVIPEVESGPEVVETLDDHLEHLISEFNVDDGQNAPISPTSTTKTPQAQKESIFLRLSNRIKALERNMSLSSQYLEELSKRYKKQVEEMQNLLEKTVISLHEESLKRDLRNKQLEDRIDNLTTMMESLLDERQNWFFSLYLLGFGVLFIFGIYFFCRKYTTCVDSNKNNKKNTEVFRRKSIDVVTHKSTEKKKRRPSDQAMKIVRCSAVNTEDEIFRTNQRQRKRKKKQIIKKSNSIGNLKEEKHCSNLESDERADWVEQNHQAIEDIPFVLDESENTALDSYPLESEIKIESPNYLRSALSFRLSRSSSSSQSNRKEETLEKINEDGFNKNRNPILSNSVNGDISSNSCVEPIKKEKKGIKKLLKKVF